MSLKPLNWNKFSFWYAFREAVHILYLKYIYYLFVSTHHFSFYHDTWDEFQTVWQEEKKIKTTLKLNTYLTHRDLFDLCEWKLILNYKYVLQLPKAQISNVFLHSLKGPLKKHDNFNQWIKFTLKWRTVTCYFQLRVYHRVEASPVTQLSSTSSLPIGLFSPGFWPSARGVTVLSSPPSRVPGSWQAGVMGLGCVADRDPAAYLAARSRLCCVLLWAQTPAQPLVSMSLWVDEVSRPCLGLDCQIETILPRVHVCVGHSVVPKPSRSMPWMDAVNAVFYQRSLVKAQTPTHRYRIGSY